MGFCFLVLLLATRNIIQAALSLMCVSIIIISVVAIMHMKGWQLGVSESISVVILIGFSVDYVIHLSADYMHSSFESRHDKMKQAFSEMGVSILSGTITTFGSGAFLFGGNIVTFQKFAVLITSTISISFLIAMLFFGALCHIMGPMNGKGDCCRPNLKASTEPGEI